VSLYLTPKEVAELTDRVRPSAQARRLRKLGIPFLWTPGELVKVPRSYATGERVVIGIDHGREPDFTVFGRPA